MQSLRLQLLAGLVVSSSAFSCTLAPSIATTPARAGAVAPAVALAPMNRVSRLATAQMGLFGLGGPELAVIGLVALFIVGPDQLKVLAKDLGKATPQLKEVAGEALEGFKETSVETLKEAKEVATPALTELKEAATPALQGLTESALKEAKEVAAAVAEGARDAEVPSGTAAVSTDSKA